MNVSEHINPNLIDFWNQDNDLFSYRKARTRVLYGGRASSKSWEIITRLILLSLYAKRPIKILCTRAFQSSINESVKALIEVRIAQLGLNSFFIIQRNRIFSKSGSLFLFYGLARNTGEVKGLEGIDICFIEEGQYITEEMYDIIAPTIRTEGSEIWISFNPLNYYDFFYQKHIINNEDNAIVRKINYTENPYLSNTLLDEIESYKDNPNFNHVYLGEVMDSDGECFFRLEWLSSLIDAHEILTFKSNTHQIGYDVADAGSDSNVYAVNENNVLTSFKEWFGKEDELDISTERVIKASKGNALIVYDSIGVGVGVGAFLKIAKREKRIHRYAKFIASASVDNPSSRYRTMGTMTEITNKEAFLNLKAQQWQDLADRIQMTYNAIVKDSKYDPSRVISISSSIPKNEADSLFMELLSVKKEIVKDRTIKAQSKIDMKKEGKASPNKADAFIMSFYKKKLAF